MLSLIVEGWNDLERIKGVYSDLDIVVTGGTKINNRLRKKISNRLAKGNNVYILSDPDAAGDQLAKMLTSEYPSLPRILVNKEEACYFTGKRMRYGVEFMSHDSIKSLLGGVICAHAETINDQA